MAACWESGFIEFKLDFEATKTHAIGHIVCSNDFSAGGHVWRVNCYPHGDRTDNNGVYLSLFLQLVSDSKNVKAIFDAFLLGRDGAPSSSHARRCVQEYPPVGFTSCLWGYAQFVKRSVLESDYIKDGFVTFMLGVVVLQRDSPIPVPCSDIAGNLGHLLDCADGSDDVTFSVAGETFRAHKTILAARSPVFKAQLFGSSKAYAKMRCITLHDVKPATFQILLRFMYTDELPRDESCSDSKSNIDMFLDLLAAADMYQLNRLKLMCARKLWEECVTAETVAKVLGCAELHNCPELKKTCLDFFVDEKNFKIAVLTEGCFQLMQSFPSVIDEIRARVRQTQT